MADDDAKNLRELNSIRDTVESIWIAIVLAFVLRAFLIEAFVIPTGSMAPRLLGEHCHLQCPSCGYEFDFGIQTPTATSADMPHDRGTPTAAGAASCPNCLFPYPSSDPAFVDSGDRVLVLKYPYRFYNLAPPQPWDVVVFRNPQTHRDNYIKRLIGLPGETIEIVHGDIFVKPEGGTEFAIRRKPKSAQDVMWQVVLDNDYQYSDERRTKPKSELPAAPHIEPTPAASWTVADGGRTFGFNGGAPAELRFEATRNVFLPMYGYDERRRTMSSVNERVDVCGDLKVQFVYAPKADGGQVAVTIASLGYQFRGELAADGTALLRYRIDRPDAQWQAWEPTGNAGPLKQGACYTVALTNVDFKVTLWVNDKPVVESPDDKYPITYTSLKDMVVRAAAADIPQPHVSVQTWGSAAQVMHVQIMRDVYYTQNSPQESDPRGIDPLFDFSRQLAKSQGITFDRGWGTMGHPITLRHDTTDPDLDQFFVLGDNSPLSLDSRCWVKAAPSLRLDSYQLGTVPRYDMLGRAWFVYWPSGFRLPRVNSLPIVPNVGKMRLIR